MIQKYSIVGLIIISNLHCSGTRNPKLLFQPLVHTILHNFIYYQKLRYSHVTFCILAFLLCITFQQSHIQQAMPQLAVCNYMHSELVDSYLFPQWSVQCILSPNHVLCPGILSCGNFVMFFSSIF